MSTLFVDYREEIKRLISELYEPADDLSKEFSYTTIKLTLLLKQILPFESVDDHLVYECLLELKFKPIEIPGKPLTFRWYFKRKNNF